MLHLQRFYIYCIIKSHLIIYCIGGKVTKRMYCYKMIRVIPIDYCQLHMNNNMSEIEGVNPIQTGSGPYGPQK